MFVRLKGKRTIPEREDVTKLNMSDSPKPAKLVRTSKSALAAAESDPVISDHLVAIAQLKEEIAALNKQLGLKDAQLREKDKQVM